MQEFKEFLSSHINIFAIDYPENSNFQLWFIALYLNTCTVSYDLV